MRPRMQVMTITESAAERVRSAVANADNPVLFLLVVVKNCGFAGMSYTV